MRLCCLSATFLSLFQTPKRIGLMATMIADEARDIEGVKVKTAQPNSAKPLPTLPIPKSANTPKPTQAVPTQQVSQQDFEPIQAIKPIAPN